MSASGVTEKEHVLDALGVQRHAPVEIDGKAVEATFAPSDGEELSNALATLSEHRIFAIIRGGGSRITFGNSPRAADVLLSTEALGGVDEFDSEDGVLHAGSGTRLSDIQKQIGGDGWELPVDAPSENSTLGGALATAAVGPRRGGFGPVRDCVLGMEVVLSTGERTRCGGRVVKNVTGYDLAKLYTGSLGTLGVIEGAWLRLRPTPEANRFFLATAKDLKEGFTCAREASLRTSARCVALLCPRASVACEAGDGWSILVEFSGDASVVSRDSTWWSGRMSSVIPAEIDALERLRSLQSSVVEVGGLRARASMLPSQLVGASGALGGSVHAQILYPGSGLLYAYSGGAAASLETAVNACQGVVRAQKNSRGSVVLEELPTAEKSGRDVFGEPGPEWRLMKSLKERFDPMGVLNPGRFLGGI